MVEMSILTLGGEDTFTLKCQDLISQWHSVISQKNRIISTLM